MRRNKTVRDRLNDNKTAKKIKVTNRARTRMFMFLVLFMPEKGCRFVSAPSVTNL